MKLLETISNKELCDKRGQEEEIMVGTERRKLNWFNIQQEGKGSTEREALKWNLQVSGNRR
jgi:hypothetical protein